MKHISKTKTVMHQNGSSCQVLEYGAGDNLDVAIATINGRYPEIGFVLNERSEEAVYVIAGTGSLTTKNTTAALAQGDAAFIAVDEAYYFEGNDLQLVITCTPPWTPDQHQEVV